MSRSYKHTPRSGKQKDKYFKRYSNRKVRRLPIDEHPSKGKTYKKVLHDYSICDYETVGISFEEYWRHLKRRFGNCPNLLGTKEEAYREYIKWFIRK